MTESGQESTALRKVTLSIAALAFFVVMAEDISKVVTIGRDATDTGYYIARAALYFIAGAMLIRTAYGGISTKIYYGMCVVMLLIVVCDLIMARGLTIELIIPSLGCSVVQIIDEKWDRTIVKVWAFFLMAAFVLIIIASAWKIAVK